MARFHELLVQVTGRLRRDETRIHLVPAGTARGQEEMPCVHMHDSWELIIALTGRVFYLAGKSRSGYLETGDILLIPPQTVHASIGAMPERHSQDMSYLSITLEGNSSSLAYHVIRDRNFELRELNETLEREWHKRLLADPAAVLDRIADALQDAADAASVAYGESLLLCCLTSLASAMKDEDCASLSGAEQAVQRVTIHMRRRYADSTLDLSALARAAGVTPTYLASIYKKITGSTIRQDLIAMRIERAERLLQMGRFSVKEVAALTGWHSALYFSSAYRKHRGHPPSGRRRKPRTP